jgi:predicted peroxiredoxin
MAKLLLTGTHGADDPTRATMPFHVARGAIEAGHQVSISLMADAPAILKNELRDTITGVAVPPLKDLLQFAIEKGVRVYV